MEEKETLLKADGHYLLIHTVLILSTEHCWGVSKIKAKADESVSEFRFLGHSVTFRHQVLLYTTLEGLKDVTSVSFRNQGLVLNYPMDAHTAVLYYQ